jgi:hypothetical protein
MAPLNQLVSIPTHHFTNSPAHQLTSSPTHQLTSFHTCQGNDLKIFERKFAFPNFSYYFGSELAAYLHIIFYLL